MGKKTTCEACGRYGPAELRFGINYCPDCMEALRNEDKDYFVRIGLGRATERAKDDITATVMAKAEREEALQKEAERKNERDRQAVEEAGGYWEYKAVSLYDNDSGFIDAASIENTINDLGRQGWRLRCAFANEMGRNSSSSGVGGISSGTNATIDQNIMIFERFVRL